MAGQPYVSMERTLVYIKYIYIYIYGFFFDPWKKGQGFWFAAHHEKSVLIAHSTADFREPLGECFIK